MAKPKLLPPGSPKEEGQLKKWESDGQEDHPCQPKNAAKPHPPTKPKAKPAPRPQPALLVSRGRDSYGNTPGVGYTWYVPWEEGGNGGTVNQVTMLGAWDEDLCPDEWWMVSQGSNGECGEKGKQGKKSKIEKEGGTFRVPSSLLFAIREEAETYLREAMGHSLGTR